MMTSMGLAASMLGINAVAGNMPNSTFPVLFIISLAIGGLIGQKLEIDDKFQSVANKFGKDGLARGLSTAVLLFA